MNLYNINKERKALAIWQQNLNKSPSGQHALISSGRLAKHNIDIIALQEPAVNFLNKTIASRDWIPIYPTTHDKAPEKTRTIILIRGDVLTESWEQLDFPSGDVTVLHIKEVWGTMTLFNIYNDCEHDVTLEALTAYHRQHTQSILGTDRDCHGYTRGNPWAFKRAQEEPKRIRNEGAMVKTVFGPYLLHYLSVWALLGLV
jgi:hypothetical protein